MRATTEKQKATPGLNLAMRRRSSEPRKFAKGAHEVVMDAQLPQPILGKLLTQLKIARRIQMHKNQKSDREVRRGEDDAGAGDIQTRSGRGGAESGEHGPAVHGSRDAQSKGLFMWICGVTNGRVTMEPLAQATLNGRKVVGEVKRAAGSVDSCEAVLFAKVQ